MDTPFIVAYFLSFAVLSGAIYGLFAKAGKNVKDDSKKVVSKWLQNISLDEDTPNWPATFALLFDRVFTERHLSWKCFFRSSIASIISVIILLMICGLIYGIIPLKVTIERTGVNILLILVLTGYLSLLQSRYIIKLLSKSSSVLNQCFYLFVDLILSGAIIYSWFVLMRILIGEMSVSRALAGTWEDLLKSLDLVSRLGLQLDMLGILFYSTFFTSIWIWLYISSGLAIKFLLGGKKFFAFFQKHLNIEKNPFKAMGFVLIILLSFAYLIGGAIMLIT